MSNYFDDMYYSEKSKSGMLNKLDEIYKKRDKKISDLDDKAWKLDKLRTYKDDDVKKDALIQRKVAKLDAEANKLKTIRSQRNIYKSDYDAYIKGKQYTSKDDKQANRRDRKYSILGSNSKYKTQPKQSMSHEYAKVMGYTTVKESVADLIFSAYKENVIDTDEVKMLLECTDLDVIIGYLDE